MGAMTMTCDVITEIWGPLRYTDEVWAELQNDASIQAEIRRTSEEQTRRAGSVLNPSKDGYYESKRFIEVKSTMGYIRCNKI